VSPSAGGTVQAVQGGIRASQGSSAWRPLAAAAVLAALTALALSAASGSARAGSAALYELDQVATFDAPVYADDDGVHPNLLFVVEQAGRIRVVRNGQKLDRPFLDIREKVQFGGEQGLLSVAFDPDYDDNRRFYVYYVNNGGDIRIDGFRARSGKPARAAAGSGKRVIKVDHDQAGNHNGGQLQFGPDGHLYAGTGDGGPQMDPENDAQDPASLLGKVLRVDPLPGGGYDIPNDNPYVGEDGANEIFALGLRNPWRFSFDSVTGALTIGDVGGTDWEEIDYVASPGGGEPGGLGANFGWNDFEGFAPFEGAHPPTASPTVKPIKAYPLKGRACAIVGGYVVRDRRLRSLFHRYVYGDFCAGWVRSLIPDPGGARKDRNAGVRVPQLSSFGEAADGSLYATSLNGPVYRFVRRR
jgi:glucose/arabinose dehydrogenase